MKDEKVADHDDNGASAPDSASPLAHAAARTLISNQLIYGCFRGGVDGVVNLSAGMDIRPYRMPVPARFAWAEAFWPEVVTYKNKRLATLTPLCYLRRTGQPFLDTFRAGTTEKEAIVHWETEVPNTISPILNSKERLPEKFLQQTVAIPV